MRNFKKLTSALLAVFITALFLGGNSATINAKQNSLDTGLKIHYIDVGQADSELIEVDGKKILIDAGCDDSKALNYLKSLNVKTLDYVIATHPHEDHIGAMATIIDNFEIKNFYAPKVNHTTRTYENMLNALKKKGIKITSPTVLSSITIGNGVLEFLAPNKDKYDGMNNYSIVSKLKYGNRAFLFQGDAEALSEGQILQKNLDVSCDVLKLGHHGSHSSTSDKYLDAANPKYAIISCGEGNDYGHPHSETIDKLDRRGIKYLRTDLVGTIILTSDGNSISFNTGDTDIDAETTTETEVTEPDITEPETETYDSEIVWVSSKTSKVYHKDKNCSHMKNPQELKMDDAINNGLHSCSKCYK